MKGFNRAHSLVGIARWRACVGPGIFPDQEEIKDMPYVNIRITKEGATAEQKAKLIEGATKLVVDILGKNPQTTFVIIDEVETDNWGIAGQSVTARRRQGK
jgi:4-oxalocrotonate tautomerase